MMLIVEIPAGVEAGLAREARARGVALPALAARLLEEAVATTIATAATRQAHPLRSPEQIRTWLDSLTEFSDQIPALGNETFSHRSILPDQYSQGIIQRPGIYSN